MYVHRFLFSFPPSSSTTPTRRTAISRSSSIHQLWLLKGSNQSLDRLQDVILSDLASRPRPLPFRAFLDAISHRHQCNGYLGIEASLEHAGLCARTIITQSVLQPNLIVVFRSLRIWFSSHFGHTSVHQTWKGPRPKAVVIELEFYLLAGVHARHWWTEVQLDDVFFSIITIRVRRNEVSNYLTTYLSYRNSIILSFRFVVM